MATNESAEVDAAIDSGAAFAALHEHSGVALAFFSIGGRFLRVNPAFCRLLGYTEEELLQKTHLDVDARRRHGSRRGLARPGDLRQGQAAHHQRRYVHKDGIDGLGARRRRGGARRGRAPRVHGAGAQRHHGAEDGVRKTSAASGA